jgi:hypothetical protein
MGLSKTSSGLHLVRMQYFHNHSSNFLFDLDQKPPFKIFLFKV